MAYPDKYARLYDYVSYQNSNPARPLPATKVHADLNSLAETSDEVVEFLKLFSRSDGALANGSVGYDQLSASLQTAGLAPAAAWVTATAYAVGVNVVINTNLYRCIVAHTSGVFATDLAAGDWLFVVALPSGAPGYLSGSGGTVTQATNKTTAVTLNKGTGAITLNNASLGAATIVSFAFNNSLMAATDQLVVTHESGGTTGAYTVNGRATGAGTAAIDVRNNTAGALGEALVLRFSIIKSVNG